MHLTASRLRDHMVGFRFTSGSWWVSLAAITGILIFVSFVISRSYIAHNSLDLNESKRVSTCSAEVLKSIKPPLLVIDLPLLDRVNYMCYQQAFQEDSLTDFGIRKSAYLNQQVQTPVMLWMVVAITISGVLLAGLQILAAYKLAASGRAAFEQGGQLSVESNKISLSSSVTGVLILVVSLAFFFIFVKYVYLIQEVDLKTGVSPSTAFVEQTLKSADSSVQSTPASTPAMSVSPSQIVPSPTPVSTGPIKPSAQAQPQMMVAPVQIRPSANGVPASPKKSTPGSQGAAKKESNGSTQPN